MNKGEGTLSYQRSAFYQLVYWQPAQGEKSGSSGERLLAMSIPRIQIPSTIRFLIKSTSEFTGNAIDGLLEVDKYGELDPIAC